MTPKEVFEVAELAKRAGWKIDQAQLEEQTGYTLVADETPSAGGVSASPSGGFPFLNKSLELKAKSLEDEDDSPSSKLKALSSDVLSAFAKDTTPAADAIRSLLEDPTPERAQALLEQLPALIPDDPALAAVIAEEMAKQFGETVANKGGECRAEILSKWPKRGTPDRKSREERFYDMWKHKA